MDPESPLFVLAFDVGGSHVSAGLCRLADLEVLRGASASLTGIDTFDAFADLLHRLGLTAAGKEKGIGGASLAVPGPFDFNAGISLIEHKLKPLYRKDLRGALARRFGWEPRRFRFLNDASAYLLGELGAGIIQGAERAAGLTLGTGIGSAFAIHDRCVTEGPGVPPDGQIWNLPYAGVTVEVLISTRALKAGYLARTGHDIEVAQIAAAAPQDPEARAIFEEFGARLGQVLRDIVAPFRPDKVMVGGGISRSAHLFLPVAEKQIAGLGFSVFRSTLLDDAPLVGAAHFWRQEMTLSADSPDPAPVASAKI